MGAAEEGAIEELMTAVSNITQLAESDLKAFAKLIDHSGDLLRQDALEVAIAAGDRLLAAEVGSEEARATLHYFLANAWESNRLARARAEGEGKSEWENEELEREIVHLRLAARLGESAGLTRERMCQVKTNLGNAFSRVGLVIEGIAAWDDALAAVPGFSMALANRGYGLERYASRIHDPGHQGYLAKEAWRCIKAALATDEVGSIYPGARKVFEGVVARIEEYAKPELLADASLPQDPQVGRAEYDREYRQWCLGHRLFLNDLNDLGEFPAATRDVLVLPTIITEKDEGAPAFGLFNQMKQEFVSSRYLAYEGMQPAGLHFSDRDVTLVDTLDYTLYSLRVEKLKAAFRIAYSIFDKTAYFINAYFRLGVPDAQVSFRKIWYEQQDPKKGVRSALRQGYNADLLALYWLGKDLFERDEAYSSALEPEARGIADLRNHLEHKYVKVQLFGGKTAGEPIDAVAGDDIAFCLTEGMLGQHTLWVLSTVRAALIYLGGAVYGEEARRGALRPGTKTAPVRLPVVPDEFRDIDW